MTDKLAKWIFWVGTLTSGILFLILSWDTTQQIGALTKAENLTEQVVNGKRVWQKYNCNDCHTILGFGGYYAPDMTRAYLRLGDANLRNVVRNPEQVFAKSMRHMPKLPLSDQELTDLVAFFKWTSEIENNNWPPQDAKLKGGSLIPSRLEADGLSRGAAMFKTSGCFGCHKLQGVGGDVGPELDHIGSEMDAAKIAQLIGNPQSVEPKSTMPPQNLSLEDRTALGEFLARQK